MDGDGDFVVAWQARQDGSATASSPGASAPPASPRRAEFQVNTYTRRTRPSTAVAMDADGDFVVAWASIDQDGADYGVYARRFTPAACPGGEFRVNTSTYRRQGVPAVAMDETATSSSPGTTARTARATASTRSASRQREGDVDGNGLVEPLTDGLLTLRYLFGFRGATLVNGAVAPDCTRCTTPAIESYIVGNV